MATTVRNVLLEVIGQSDDAQRSLESIGGAVRSLPDRKTIEVRADIETARKRVEEMRQSLRSIDRAQATPEVRVQITKALSQLDKFDERLQHLGDETVSVDVEVKREKLDRELAALRASLSKLERRPALVKVEADTAAAAAKVADLQRRLKVATETREIDLTVDSARLEADLAKARAALDRIGESSGLKRLDAQLETANRALAKTLDRLRKAEDSPKVDPGRVRELQAQMDAAEQKVRDLTARRAQVVIVVEAQTKAAEARIAQVQREIEELPARKTIGVEVERRRLSEQLERASAELEALTARRREVLIDVQARTATAESNIARVEAELAALPDEKEIRVEINRGILSDVNDIDRGLTTLSRNLDRASQPARTFGETLAAGVATVKSITPALNGLAILIGVKLVAGLIAVGASALGAVGGILALGSAFVAALGPAVVVAIGVLNRFAKVLEALKLQDAAADAAGRKTAAGSAAAAAAAEQRQAAEDGLRDALQARETAERNLEAAQVAAADRIVAAKQRVQDADRALDDANRQVADAVEAGFDAIRDAAEQAAEAVERVATAEISLDRARFNVKKAQQALEELKATIGGDELSEAFQKFTDVDFQFDASALEDVLKGTDATAADKLDIEDAILRVREAKDAEAGATDDLADSERAATEARKENLKYQQQGLAAYAPLAAAIRQQDEAQRNLADATREYNTVAAQGVNKAPAVIAAAEGLRDAEERLAAARRRNRTAGLSSGLTEQQQRAKEATDKLTDSERSLLGVIKKVRAEASAFFGGATDQVIGAFTRAIAVSPMLLAPLRASFTQLGASIADVVDRLTAFVINPAQIASFDSLLRSAGDVVEILGGDIFLTLYRIFLDIAEAAMPALIDALADFATWLKAIGKQTGDVSVLQPIIDAMVGSFRAFASLAGGVLDVLVAIIGTAGPLGDGLVKTLAEALHNFADFLRSAEGKNKVRDFFADTLPSVIGLVKFMVLLVKIFLKALQLISPFLAGFLKGVNILLGLVDAILGFLNGIVSNPVGRFIRDFIGQLLGVGSILRLFGRLAAFIGSLPSLLSRVGLRVGGYLIKPFADAANFIIRVLSRLPGRAGKIAEGIPGAVKAGITKAVGALSTAGRFVIDTLVVAARAVFGRVVSVGGGIVRSIVSGIKAAATAILNASRWMVEKVASGVRAVIGLLVGVGGAMLTGLIDGFTTIGSKVLEAITGLGKKIVKAVKKVLGIKSPSTVMQKLGEHMLAGLIKGFTSGNIIDFVKEHLGGLAGLALSLPVKVIGKLGDLAGDALDFGKGLVGLALGGIVTGPTAALIGERPGVSEAVLPLTTSVLRKLASAIMGQMGSFPMAPAFAGGGRGAIQSAQQGSSGPLMHVEKMEIPIIAPAGTQPDVETTVEAIGRRLERRAAGSPRA